MKSGAQPGQTPNLQAGPAQSVKMYAIDIQYPGLVPRRSRFTSDCYCSLCLGVPVHTRRIFLPGLATCCLNVC